MVFLEEGVDSASVMASLNTRENLLHVNMEGPHAVHQVVTDDTMKHLVEMVTLHVGISVNSRRMLFLAMSPLAWINHLTLFVGGMKWASTPWECLLKDKKNKNGDEIESELFWNS